MVLVATILGLDHLKTTAYHPQANGIVERGHRAFTKALAILVQQSGNSWVDELPNVLWADRVTVKRSTGRSPHALLYGREPLMPVHFEVPVFGLWESTIKPEMTDDEKSAHLILSRVKAIEILNNNIQDAIVRLRAMKQYNKEMHDAQRSVRKE